MLNPRHPEAALIFLRQLEIRAALRACRSNERKEIGGIRVKGGGRGPS